ncbi:MAG: hypothetical protein JWM28_1995, partial [Chitinophagaceae bacterium]|nr:hypothetical protein [Chitinophagaceae bacterium]
SMKKTISLVLVIFCVASAQSQLKVKAKCDEFYIDILGGTVNEARPDYTMGQIKTKMPCFTSSDEEGNATAKCGATIFYKDRDVYFYTDRDYIEIGEKFKGRMSVPLIGMLRKAVVKYFGQPKLKDDGWDAFQTSYGLAVLHYNKMGKVFLIQLTTKNTATLQLCE